MTARDDYAKVKARVAEYRNLVGHSHVCGRECMWRAPDGTVAHPKCWKGRA